MGDTRGATQVSPVLSPARRMMEIQHGGLSMNWLRTRLGIWMMVVIAMFCIVGPALAVEIIPLSLEERAATGANYKMRFRYSDFTETVVDTAQTFTNFAVAAKFGVECKAVLLKTAFAAPVGSNALTVAVGDGTDADLYVSSMPISTNGTVWLQYGRGTTNVSANITFLTNVAEVTQNVVTGLTQTALNFATNVTVLTTTLTNMTEHTAGIADIVCVTGVSVNVSSGLASSTAVTASNLSDVTTSGTTGVGSSTTFYGRKVYTAADTVDVVFTPSNGESLDDFTAGEIFVYLHIWDARKPY